MITAHTKPSDLTAEERITIYTHAFCFYVMEKNGCDMEEAKSVMANYCAGVQEAIALYAQVNEC